MAVRSGALAGGGRPEHHIEEVHECLEAVLPVELRGTLRLKELKGQGPDGGRPVGAFTCIFLASDDKCTFIASVEAQEHN